MKNDTPQDFQLLFSEVTAKYLSKDLQVEQTFASKAFGEVTEAMVSHLEKDHPGMEGLMGYAKQHQFDHTAVRGIWIAMGVCAGLKGPRQKEYIVRAGKLAKNSLIAEGFGPLVGEMKLAFQRVNQGAQHTLLSTFSKPFKTSLEALMEKAWQPSNPLFYASREEPEQQSSKRTAAQYGNVFETINSRVEGVGPNADIVIKDAGFKEMVETIFRDFNREYPGLPDMVGFVRQNGMSISSIKGVWNAMGIAAATESPRQAHWIGLAGSYSAALKEFSDDFAELHDKLAGYMKQGFEKSADQAQIERLKSQASGLADFLTQIQTLPVDRGLNPEPSDATLSR
ncbi:hypothetical protein [Pseudomonas amygdali]|uniref:Uncharacterized protein n=2 Tax=Pseudomonas amygdali pv. lachrymans TaxID=53707 RepID=A0ABR5KQT8_PSEAV|nr:hypothetical protein [Pseudomonas amygdali]AXH59637.1 hypothetical protein PLA107_030910 [Pseudomonas amygdali pv. lachrymans str. M301315]KPC17066.1 Uncharacterized protein AC499_0268 [Pseudomonas amygdali pv. lachrymans]KPC18025.1 Uncharacterized protein AC499_1227 [Pseudomonas amygdali pv. lachrymans]RMT05970.1 hypothetical protein ALP54_03554 [Pseudomonas amygdali pv. lachrymans]